MNKGLIINLIDEREGKEKSDFFQFNGGIVEFVDFLSEKLLKVLAGRADREVYVRADKTVPYGVVVRVMSEIKGAGIEKLGMITDPLDRDDGTSRLDKIVDQKTK